MPAARGTKPVKGGKIAGIPTTVIVVGGVAVLAWWYMSRQSGSGGTFGVGAGAGGGGGVGPAGLRGRRGIRGPRGQGGLPPCPPGHVRVGRRCVRWPPKRKPPKRKRHPQHARRTAAVHRRVVDQRARHR